MRRRAYCSSTWVGHRNVLFICILPGRFMALDSRPKEASNTHGIFLALHSTGELDLDCCRQISISFFSLCCIFYLLGLVCLFQNGLGCLKWYLTIQISIYLVHVTWLHCLQGLSLALLSGKRFWTQVGLTGHCWAGFDLSVSLFSGGNFSPLLLLDPSHTFSSTV